MSGDGSEGSVTHWIQEIKAGNRVWVNSLWHRYFSRMVSLARGQIQTGNRRVSDEEDVAISVFESFCRAAENGRFPDLTDRDTLWRLIVKMSARKVVDKRRRDTRQRRGGDQSKSEIAADENLLLLATVVGNEPTPEFVSMMTEQVHRLIQCLQKPQLQELAVGKMEGYSNEEMAKRLDCSISTIERRLRLIRETIKQELS